MLRTSERLKIQSARLIRHSHGKRPYQRFLFLIGPKSLDFFWSNYRVLQVDGLDETRDTHVTRNIG